MYKNFILRIGGLHLKAIVYHRYGGPELLKIEEFKRPFAAKGNVIVKVICAAVNPADWQVRSGKRTRLREPFMFIPGIDLSGIVEEVGPGVSKLSPGDHVFGLAPFDLEKEGRGSYAEFVEVPDRRITKMSAKMSFEHAAALPVAVQTVWNALFEIGGISSNHTILIHGASGGVGHIAVQMAKWQRAIVAGAASGRNQEFLQEIGVDMPINYETTAFQDVVSNIDIVFDTIVRDADSYIDNTASDTREHSWNVLKKGGILISITGKPDMEKAYKLGVRAAKADAGDCSKVLEQVAKIYDSGHLRPYISRVFPLEQAREANELSQQGHTRGKIIIKI
jgi:NADPH:quinone reductase-like Zn-dependent oxidoreductase